MGRIFSINLSSAKGVPKERRGRALLLKGLGLEGDAHAGTDIRQVSLLDIESVRCQIADAKAKGASVEIRPGIYAENITTEGLALSELKIGETLKAGETALLRISQIGKECHDRCAIYREVGDCIMPRKGIFAEVVEGGEITVGDEIEKL
ncbi:MAG: MOSC domain-containing protein [Elusimicrobia bacterium]|nr:MOSC domain-containing protein [Elusimicrobiota bacterium]